MKRWHVVQTQPGKERLAQTHLVNQHFDTFYPTVRRMRRIGSRMREVLDPFFPNYLFARFDTQRQRWRSINGTIGVIRLVSFGSRTEALPSPVPHGLVESFLALSNAEGELRFAERLGPGDRVRIVGGPFDALCGEFERADDSERAIILLDILSRSTRVTIERDRLVTA